MKPQIYTFRAWFGRILTLIVLVGLCAVLFSFTPWARAQDLTDIPLDVRAWFTNVTALAGVIAAITALVRKTIWKTLDGNSVILFCLALGAGLGVGGHFLGYLALGLVGSLVFGLSAGIGAPALIEGLRAATGNQKPALPSNTSSTLPGSSKR